VNVEVNILCILKGQRMETMTHAAGVYGRNVAMKTVPSHGKAAFGFRLQGSARFGRKVNKHGVLWQGWDPGHASKTSEGGNRRKSNPFSRGVHVARPKTVGSFLMKAAMSFSMLYFSSACVAQSMRPSLDAACVQRETGHPSFRYWPRLSCPQRV